MATPFNVAASAYGNAAKLISQVAKGSEPKLGGSDTNSDFAKLLAQSVQGVVDTGNKSDAMAMDMVNGKANVVDMVTAMTETELAMETMVSVRDRVISAYEEIMRMPI
ncbi:MAG: FliE [Devosia sp.]|nr:FliE [Devosia sp.]